MKHKNPAFFIVGCPRSGTTMLASLLDKHTDISVPPETHFFNETAIENSDTLSWNHEQIARKMFSNLRIKDLNIDPEQFISFFKSQYSPDFKEIFRALADFYLKQNNKLIFGEKTPNHLLKVDQILEWYPDSKIILIIRDGRDVVMSLKAVPWIHNDVRRLSYLWKERISEGEKILAKYPSKIYKVYYEDILDNPEFILKDISKFLGVNFQEQQLSENMSTTVMPNWEKAWKSNVNRKITSSNKAKWKKNATNDEKCIMDFVMGKTLSELHYEESTNIVCKARIIIQNWILNIILDTKLRSMFARIKKIFVSMGLLSSSTTPEMNVNEYLKEKYNVKN